MPDKEDTKAYLWLLFLVLLDRPEFHTWNLKRSQQTPTASVIISITITITKKCIKDGAQLLSAYYVYWLEEVLRLITDLFWGSPHLAGV